MLAPRPVRHYWTDDEFNLLARCRAHHWSFDRIQKTHFPSLTRRAVFLALARFKRFRVKERSYRASLVDTSATTPRSTSRREESTRSDHTPEPSSSSHTTPQPDGTIEVTRFSASRHKRKSTLATTVTTASRYNLRPSRRKSFQNTQSRVTVDRSRFPHFSESYKNHLESDGIPDTDYIPPSRSPTLHSSDRSPLSSQARLAKHRARSSSASRHALLAYQTAIRLLPQARLAKHQVKNSLVLKSSYLQNDRYYEIRAIWPKLVLQRHSNT